MEEIMLGNGRMVKNTVKEHSFFMMGEIMLGNGRMVKNGTEQDITKMGKSL